MCVAAWQGFYFFFFLRDKKVNLRRVSPEGPCSFKDDLAVCKIQMETERAVRCDPRASLGFGRIHAFLAPKGRGFAVLPSNEGSTIQENICDDRNILYLLRPTGSCYSHVGVEPLKCDYRVSATELFI